MGKMTQARKLLVRFDNALHEHAAEKRELEAAGVPAHQIASLYPAGAANYTLKLGEALSNSQVHSAARRLFRRPANSPAGQAVIYELSRTMKRQHGADPARRSINVEEILGLVKIDEELMQDLVQQLLQERPAAYSSRAQAIEFASMLYSIPELLLALRDTPGLNIREGLIMMVFQKREMDVAAYLSRVGQLLDVIR